MMKERGEKIKMEDFFKKGMLPSKQVVLMRKDLVSKLKYLALQGTKENKLATADLLNNIVEHFFETYKEDLDAFIKKCHADGFKILN